MHVTKILKSFGFAVVLPALLALSFSAIALAAGPDLQGATCDCSADTLDCRNFGSAREAQACFDACLASAGFDVHDLDVDGDGLACETTAYTSGTSPTPAAAPQSAPTLPEAVPGANNKIFNGNFEFGFYQVPQLGFEAVDVGNVPNYWGWYKSNTHGKVTIENNQRFGLVCKDDAGMAETINNPPDDPNSPFGPVPDVVYQRPNNALSLHMQSTDEPDMRLGVYQTVAVVPGLDYRFSMSGTIQVQSGGGTLQPDDAEAPIEAQNHTIEVSFDQNGGNDWKAIPLEKRQVVEFKEEKLEFKISEDNEDIATVQDFETVVHAESDRMTIFITGWRKWANWRTAIFTIDCVSLEP
ncbi:MAG: hypothetical protein D6768_18295, partial [Chloroflexi bacterium]